MGKKLYRIEAGKIIAGVCGGIGDYFNVDYNIVRIGFVLLGMCGGIGVVAYIVAAIIVPTKSQIH
jgi:phage shock protein C